MKKLLSALLTLMLLTGCAWAEEEAMPVSYTHLTLPTKA